MTLANKIHDRLSDIGQVSYLVMGEKVGIYDITCQKHSALASFNHESVSFFYSQLTVHFKTKSVDESGQMRRFELIQSIGVSASVAIKPVCMHYIFFFFFLFFFFLT